MKKFLLSSFIVLMGLLNGGTVYAAQETIRFYPEFDGRNALTNVDNQTDWFAARNFNGELTLDPSNEVDHLHSRSDLALGKFRIYRTSMLFDVSSLPDEAVVESVSLNVYKEESNNDGDTGIVFTKHQWSDPFHLSKDDWFIDNYTTEYSRGILLDDEYTKFTFNSDGVSDVVFYDQFIIGGLTVYDFDNINPGSEQRTVSFYSTESSGVDKDPYLEVVYTVEEEKSLDELVEELEEVVETEVSGKSGQNSFLAQIKKISNFFLP